VVIVGSAAGTETYARGAGYTAAEFGAHAVFGSLRLELPGEDVRGTEVIPGDVRTEFGLVRFEGDEREGRGAVQRHHAAHPRRRRRVRPLGRLPAPARQRGPPRREAGAPPGAVTLFARA
jgi:NAD(P)-dependent dehydrogenase (short-subunit alcohol dehydrogenase family)